MQRRVSARAPESNVGSLCSRVTGGGNDEQQRARLTRASSVSHRMCIRCMDGRVSSVGGRIRCAMCAPRSLGRISVVVHLHILGGGKVRGELNVHTLQKVDSMAARAMGHIADTDKVNDECDI